MNFAAKDVSLEKLNLVAATIVEMAEPGDVFILVGDIGSGKTTFVSQIGKILNSTIEATSPTFAIVAEYPLVAEVKGIKKIIHVDTYRLQSVNELYDLGLETVFDESAITFIEWGEKIEDHIDENHFRISFEDFQVNASSESRNITFEIRGNISESRLRLISELFSDSGWELND